MLDRVANIIGLLILAYLVFTAENFSNVVGGIGSSASGLIGTLQGRKVDFAGGVRVG